MLLLLCLQIHMFCKMISDFSLEYRTLYSKMLQKNEKRKRKTGVLIPTVSFCDCYYVPVSEDRGIKWFHCG